MIGNLLYKTHMGELVMNKLTREGARNLTAAIDRIASSVQNHAGLLGIESKIAQDFAYRCDLISDAVETQAISNFPKYADVAEEIGEVESGPIVDGEVDSDAAGHFTQEQFHQLTDIAEKLASAIVTAGRVASTEKAGNPDVFNLTE